MTSLLVATVIFALIGGLSVGLSTVTGFLSALLKGLGH